MSAAWAAVSVIAVVQLIGGGIFIGRTQQILAELQRITKDHEDRLRKGGL